MPLYEYECHRCGNRFEALVYGTTRPTCPRCKSDELEKAFSTFATASGGSSKADSCSMRTPSGGCGASGGGG
jgi:putative FmdB family regulatory protein